MTDEFRAHDLLQISPVGVRSLAESAPFAGGVLERSPFVVVRRARRKGNLLPIGIRGQERHERCEGWLHPEHILRRVAPESIQTYPLRSQLPAFAALVSLRRSWRDQNLVWGPTGSVGFELVSGWPSVHERSDLDLVIRAGTPLPSTFLHRLAAVESDLPCAVDIQIETPLGSFSPREYRGASTRVLLRTIDGPKLAVCPWGIDVRSGDRLR